MISPITTEKAVKLIEIENTLLFKVDSRMDKEEIKSEIEKLFNVKVEGVRTLMKGNEKVAYVKLNKKNPAIDVATKLGMI
ncbi:50S ribosomal protein L23 [Candidatus Pacearchaeota archaeon]|nr:50S ribosomal protein L23 [Candidatus Pacearchaeota archaeon]